MDLLSAILRDLRLESVVLSFADLHAPWGFDKNKVNGAPFHIVTEGRALLEMKGRETVELMAGDLLVLPKGTAHTLVSEPEAERVPFHDLLRANGIDPDSNQQSSTSGTRRIVDRPVGSSGFGRTRESTWGRCRSAGRTPKSRSIVSRRVVIRRLSSTIVPGSVVKCRKRWCRSTRTATPRATRSG